MDLFVINRHQEESINEEDQKLQEREKMAQLLKKIERNKKIRARQKERKKEQKAEKVKVISRTDELRERKRSIEKFKDSANKQYLEEIDSSVNNGEIQTEETRTSEKRKLKKRKMEDTSKFEGFTVLGNNEFQKKVKVKRILPKWLSEPTVISTNLQKLKSKVSAMKELDKSLRKKLKANGVQFFFPVQAVVIPWLLEEIQNSCIMFPRDICVSAPTGSGKTLAFVLPIIHCLKSYTVKKIRALIILPTQDLAMQVFKTFREYANGTNISTCLITGKNLFSVEQKQLIEDNKAFGYLSKVDILVCTAGRLVDHLKGTKGFDLQHLEFLVIDEADRVLENIQNDWLYHLEKHTESEDASYQSTKVLNLLTLRKRRPPQKLLFSATLSQDPEKLQKLSLFQPKLFTSIIEKDEADTVTQEETVTSTFLGKYTTPKELTEKYIVCSIDLKPLVLYKFIKMEDLTKTLVFTNSADSAHRLAILLSCMFKEEKKVKEMSSNAEIQKRSELIKSFTNGGIDILVCTDRLARGIDLPSVQCVISYGAPKYLKTYIHRAGRTARAGQAGLAVTLLHKNQLPKFQAALAQAGKLHLEEIVIDESTLEVLAGQYKQALSELKEAVQREGEEDLKKIKLKKRLKKMNKK